MSYSQRYSATISGTVYESVYHPASEQGSSDTIPVHWEEDVDIVITVDTSSFDLGVATLKHHIDGLTGAVIAAEAAQIDEKVRGANAIGQSVTTGFFRLIGSEITQQMAALKSRVDSLFLKMRDMKSACVRIQETMQQDYHRITDRYTSIFVELDREMAMRIASLDEAAYTFKRDAGSQNRRSFSSTLSTVPTVFSKELSGAQGVLSASALRSGMNELLQSATAYLASEKMTSKTVSSMLVANNTQDSATSSLPVAYLAADDSLTAPAERVFLPSAPGQLKDDPGLKNRILAQFRERSLRWRPLTSEDRDQVDRFLLPLVDAIHTRSGDHNVRVGQTIIRLWNAHTPEVL